MIDEQSVGPAGREGAIIETFALRTVRSGRSESARHSSPTRRPGPGELIDVLRSASQCRLWRARLSARGDGRTDGGSPNNYDAVLGSVANDAAAPHPSVDRDSLDDGGDNSTLVRAAQVSASPCGVEVLDVRQVS